jgi:uncharacterized membrane protein
MSRKNSAPTVGYLFSSQIYKWITVLVIIILLILAATAVRIAATLDSSCIYNRTQHVGKYRFEIVGINEKCKANEPK